MHCCPPKGKEQGKDVCSHYSYSTTTMEVLSTVIGKKEK